MAEMLRTPERDRLIAYLEQALLRHVTLGGRDLPALRETRDGDGQGRCWTVDAVMAAELLSQPGLRQRWPHLGDGLLDLAMAMTEGRLLCRGLVEPECRVIRDSPRDLHIVTGTHEYYGDLSRGLLRQAVRGGTPTRPLDYTGHAVTFRLGHERFHLDVEDSIVEHGIEKQPDGLLLFHESVLEVKAGLFTKRLRRVGRLRYEYRIRAGDPRLHLTVTLRTEPGITLRGLRLTTAVDQLSDEALRRFGAISIGDGRAIRRADALRPDGVTLLAKGATALVSLTEEASPGTAIGLHIAPEAPEAVVNARLVSRQGRPHWLVLRHGGVSLSGGASYTVREARLLTRGTDAEAMADYAALLRDPSVLQGRDPGLAEPGPALNAVAALLLQAEGGGCEPPLAPERRTALRHWYDRQLDAVFAAMGEGGPDGLRPSRAAPFGLGFVLLSLDAMHRTSGDERYALRLARGLDLLLALQRPDEAGGAFAEMGGAATLDGHAAAMLALARIALRWPEPRLHEALRRALAALGTGSLPMHIEGELRQVETLQVRSRREDGRWDEDGGFQTHKLGLVMRALQALLLAHRQGGLPEGAVPVEAVQARIDRCFQMLRGRVGEWGGTLELRASILAEEGSSTAQAAVLLGLTAPDESAARLAPAKIAA